MSGQQSTKDYWRCVLSQSNEKIERRICVWTTKYERLSGKCNVQHVKMKSVFTIQPIKRLVSTIIKSAKLAATFLIFLQNRELCCLLVTVHIVLQEGRVATKKRKTVSTFEDFSSPITTKHILTSPKKG